MSNSRKPGDSFPYAVGGELGYSPQQVDRLLERARATYDRVPQNDPLTAAELRSTAFTVKRGGYSARYVDSAIDRLEEVFFDRERTERMRQIGEEAWWAEIGKLLSEVRGRLNREKGKRFRRRSLFASGYRRAQVDAYLDRVSATLAGTDSLTAADVRTAVFHAQLGGYAEDQVDALLDAVVEILLAAK